MRRFMALVQRVYIAWLHNPVRPECYIPQGSNAQVKAKPPRHPVREEGEMDVKGATMTNETFLFEYPYNGSYYVLPIVADSLEEAEARFRQIQYGRYVGRNAQSIPAGPATGWLVRFVCWWRNQVPKEK